MTVFNLNKERAARLIDNLAHDPDLVGLWPMNEQSGTIVDRCTKNRYNTSTTNGTPDYSQTIGDLPAISFVRASSEGFILPAGALAFDRDDTFSFLAAVNPTTTAGAIGAILSKGDSAEPYWVWWIHLDAASAHLGFYMQKTFPGNRLWVNSNNATMPGGTSKLVGLSYDGSSTAAGVKLYIDGASVNVNVAADSLADSVLAVCPASIGQRGSPGYNQDYFMNGKIGCVAVFNAVKTAADFKRWAALSGFL